MIEFDYQQLNDIIHGRLRLAILTSIIHYGEIDFNFLKQVTGSTDGNLSINVKKLANFGYLSVKKEFIEEKPITKYSITEKGVRDYDIYVTRLLRLLRR